MRAERGAARRAGLLVGLLLLTVDLASQQTRVVMPGSEAQRPGPVGTGAITGVVAEQGTGRPIPSAIVTLEERVPGAPRRIFTQVTTPTGRFAFVDLAASDMYFLTAAKPGYLGGGYRRVDPRGPSAPLRLLDGQWLGDLRVTMTRPGSISGTVVDERGEPIVGAAVRVLPQAVIAGRVQWLAGVTARTDDRGAYRLAGLGPGRYLVSVPSVQASLPAATTVRAPMASAGTSMDDLRQMGDAARAERLLVDLGNGQQVVVGRHAVPPPPGADGRRTAYPIAFYPNAFTLRDATPVELAVSEDRTAIDFQLQPVRTARVSGVVQAPAEALRDLHLRLIPTGLEELGQGSEAATAVVSADGRFTFHDVPTGSYVLDARHDLLELTYSAIDPASTAVPAPVPFPARNAAAGPVAAGPHGVSFASLNDGTGSSHSGQLAVEVSTDIDDLVLPLRAAVTMTGRLVWAPGVKPTSASPRPVLEPADGRRSLGRLMATGGALPAGLTFRIDGLLSGEYVLRVMGAAIVSVAWDGQDSTDRPFDAREGRDFTDVVVTITSEMTSITGTINDGSAGPAADAAVIAFPIEPDRWSKYGLNPTRLKSVLASSDGTYRVDGLLVGEYFLLAVPAAQERAWLDPAFLAAQANRATRVRVDRNDAKIANLSLRLVR